MVFFYTKSLKSSVHFTLHHLLIWTKSHFQYMWLVEMIFGSRFLMYFKIQSQLSKCFIFANYSLSPLNSVFSYVFSALLKQNNMKFSQWLMPLVFFESAIGNILFSLINFKESIHFRVLEVEAIIYNSYIYNVLCNVYIIFTILHNII